MWDAEKYTHGEVCEPYLDNDSLPYVGFALREYQKEYGRFPHPLGLGGKESASEVPAKKKNKVEKD
jgi:hypothetical protein